MSATLAFFNQCHPELGRRELVESVSGSTNRRWFLNSRGAPLWRDSLFRMTALVVATAGMMLFGLSHPAHAQIPTVSVSPLKYQDSLTGSTSKLGFIDVSNPSDSTISLKSEVDAFRQINLSGDLQFYHDDAITGGITVSASEFDLGPREAVRVAFTINPNKLPKGGVYAAIFFATVPSPSVASGTIIMQSARAGTLLILDNGGAGKKSGLINQLNLSWLQLGNGLRGTIQYANQGEPPRSIAYNPTLGVRAFWWGGKSFVNGPLVFPGNKREFSFFKPGSYIGIIPLVVNDQNTGKSRVALVIAITGIWRVVALIIAVASGVLIFIIRFRRRPPH